MNITEFMDFDLAWFTTLPGMLITGGVIVLLIALIIFIVSNKKDKKKTPEVSTVNSSEMSPIVNNDIGMGMPLGDINNMPIGNDMMMNGQSNAGVTDNLNNMNDFNNINNVGMPNVNNSFDIPNVSNTSVEVPTVPSYDAPASPTNIVDFSAPTQSSINDMQTIPAVNSAIDSAIVSPSINDNLNSNPIVNTPVVPSTVSAEQVSVPTEMSEINNPISEVDIPIAPATVEPVVPAVPNFATPTQEPSMIEKPTIYGGVDPANTVHTTTEVKPVIYGGANPLENTTTIPTVTNHEAYNMSSNVTASVPETPVPVVESAVPSGNPNASVVPEPMPTVDAVTPSVMPQTETPVAPTVMPMTGAEMFGSTDNSTTGNSSNSEIETLEF